MAVDRVRSCYSTDCRFYTGDTRTATIVWYFVDKDTPYLPFPTPFRSRNWCPSEPIDPDGLGEVIDAVRPYRTGQNPGDSLGTASCGTADQWRNGQLLPPATPTPVDQFGTPLCCPRIQPPLGMVWCPAFGGLLAKTYVVGPMSVTNGTCTCVTESVWELDNDGPCHYGGRVGAISCVGPSLDVPATLTVDNKGRATLTAFLLSIPIVAYSGPAGWDGFSKVQLTRQSETVECGWPLNTFLYPGGPTVVQIGTVVLWAGIVLPTDYLLCDGSAVSRVTYAQLFAAIGTTFGPGDGVHTFNLPNSATWGTFSPAVWIVFANQ
jgi:hypothetical protein